MRRLLAGAVVLMAALVIMGLSDLNDGDAGKGFYYRLDTAQKTGLEDYVEVLGEVENRSGKDYAGVLFDLTIYGSAANVIAIDHVAVNDFEQGSTRSIHSLVKVKLEDISDYKLDYSTGFEKQEE